MQKHIGKFYLSDDNEFILTKYDKVHALLKDSYWASLRDADTMRLIDIFRSFGLYVGSVVITQFSGQPAAEAFKVKMERLGMPVSEKQRNYFR